MVPWCLRHETEFVFQFSINIFKKNNWAFSCWRLSIILHSSFCTICNSLFGLFYLWWVSRPSWHGITHCRHILTLNFHHNDCAARCIVHCTSLFALNIHVFSQKYAFEWWWNEYHWKYFNEYSLFVFPQIEFICGLWFGELCDFVKTICIVKVTDRHFSKWR